MKTKIGIISPTYDRPDLMEQLHRSISSCPTQTDWCHYVIDDGSAADYTTTFADCQKLSGRLATTRIPNSGPLIARNHAIDMAIADNCTHLCFLDDDDQLAPDGLTCIGERIRAFSDEKWLMFSSNLKQSSEWPDTPRTVSWFDDVVRKGSYGSDNLVVISADIVGQMRFSTRGRNQREWTFFFDLSRKHDQVLVCPEKLRIINYQNGGLTDQAHQQVHSLEQIHNSLERAVRYWLRRPYLPALMANAAKQILLTPMRLTSYYLAHSPKHACS